METCYRAKIIPFSIYSATKSTRSLFILIECIIKIFANNATESYLFKHIWLKALLPLNYICVFCIYPDVSLLLVWNIRNLSDDVFESNKEWL